MLEAVKNIPLSKSGIKELATLEINSIIDDGKNPIEIMEYANALIDFAETIKKDKRFVEAVRDEVAKYGKEYTTKNNTKIELAEVGTKYNFNYCNDFFLPVLQTQLEKAKKLLEERQSFLKTIPNSGIDIMNEETGELIKVFPPSKESSSSVKVTLAK